MHCDALHRLDQSLANLDELPLVSEVYKRHLNVENYFYSITQYPEVTIITGRGCPYKCVYCMWPQTLNGHGYRRRSVENVVDEFQFGQPLLAPLAIFDVSGEVNARLFAFIEINLLLFHQYSLMVLFDLSFYSLLLLLFEYDLLMDEI